jgi:hypothetical protein
MNVHVSVEILLALQRWPPPPHIVCAHLASMLAASGGNCAHTTELQRQHQHQRDQRSVHLLVHAYLLLPRVAMAAAAGGGGGGQGGGQARQLRRHWLWPQVCPIGSSFMTPFEYGKV